MKQIVIYKHKVNETTSKVSKLVLKFVKYIDMASANSEIVIINK